MFADILGYPVETVDGLELGALGGAMGAAYGLKYYDTLEEAVQNMSRIKQRVEPNTKNTEIYHKKYAIYEDLLNALEPIWEKHY